MRQQSTARVVAKKSMAMTWRHGNNIRWRALAKAMKIQQQRKNMNERAWHRQKRSNNNGSIKRQSEKSVMA